MSLVGDAPCGGRGLAPLSPIRFLLRSARVWARRPAVVEGTVTVTYAELLERCERMAGELQARGVAAGDRVAVLVPNVSAMLEAHYAVPGIGAAIVPMNTRLGEVECRHILRHSEAKVLLVHPTLEKLAERSVEGLEHKPLTMTAGGGATPRRGESGERVALAPPVDEMSLLGVNYTSGTTGQAKGVMYTHRGSYLHSLGVIAEAGLGPRSVYLWTLPMFHCNGWAYTWAVTATGAKHICLERFDADAVWKLILDEGVTHLCGAPTVLTMLVRSEQSRPLDAPVRVFTGGAPPSPALLERCESLGLHVTHLYGLTETYGPFAICAEQPDWDRLDRAERMRLIARQGVATLVSEPMRVVDPAMADVPADGETLGEVVMRGDNVTVGYFRDPEATASAFAGGWFHSGDVAVMHPDGYVELRDRAKDLIISGGENISTIEVEQALCAHDDVVEAAVVAFPDELWGEVPAAFVVTVAGRAVDPEQLRESVRGRLARYKVPKLVVFVDELPKTATGKVQKFLLRERARAAAGGHDAEREGGEPNGPGHG